MIAAAVMALPLLVWPAEKALNALEQWPQWRGPLGTGFTPRGNPPVEWSETQNLRWKTAIPGRGHSTPVVWGKHVFLTMAEVFGDILTVPEQPPGAHDNVDPLRLMRFQVLAVHRKTGTISWKTTVREAQPHQSTHASGTWASNSPVTDGQRVFAFFGSNGLYCLDIGGMILWQKDLGDMLVKHGHGEGASPVLYGNTLVVNWDHEGNSFVVALDKITGRELWRKGRDEPTSWATPIVVAHGNKPQLIISATNAIRGYDLATGKVIWQCRGMPNNVVASPVSGEGIVYAGASYARRAMFAIRLDGARGELNGTEQILWSRATATPYVPSPLLYGGTLYFFRHYQPFLSRVEGRTGTDSGPYRLPALRNIYASPVAVSNRVYLTDRDGVTLVITHAAPPKPLAVNRLDDGFSASMAVAGDQLFMRGEKHLYCIQADSSE